MRGEKVESRQPHLSQQVVDKAVVGGGKDKVPQVADDQRGEYRREKEGRAQQIAGAQLHIQDDSQRQTQHDLRPGQHHGVNQRVFNSCAHQRGTKDFYVVCKTRKVQIYGVHIGIIGKAVIDRKQERHNAEHQIHDQRRCHKHGEVFAQRTGHILLLGLSRHF